MDELVSLVPGYDDLTAGLTAVFSANGSARGGVSVLRREPTPYSTTFPCEIVTCGFQDGSQLQLFCKYTDGIGHPAHGHRGGVDLEIAVYRHVLQPLDLSQPEFFGAHTDSRTGQNWLILEYLSDSLRVGKVEDSSAMVQAAGWIAQFHAANQARLAREPVPFLRIYDKGYYLGWARRTSEFASPLCERFPWLKTLCERAEELLAPLSAFPPTIIHGEYYPHNILFHRGRVCPVDWESAAIAQGLIDLASLTEGWQEDVARQCEIGYQQTRWPGGPPAAFGETFSAARLYLQFRWLGERPEWTTAEDSQWRFEELRAIGEGLGAL